MRCYLPRTAVKNLLGKLISKLSMPNAHQKQYSLIKSTTTSHLWSGKSSLILLSFVILLHYVNNSLELSFWKLSDRFVLKNEESENTDPQGCSGPKFHSVKCVWKKDGTYPVQSQDSCSQGWASRAERKYVFSSSHPLPHSIFMLTQRDQRSLLSKVPL